MRIRQMASIWSSNWRSLVQSGIYWRFAAVNLILTGTVTAVMWPSAIGFDEPALPVTLNALLYTHGAVLAYAAISLAGGNFSRDGDLDVIDWVYHGVATPAEVVLARLAWACSVLFSLTALSFPFAISVYHLYPIPWPMLAGALGVLFTTLLCYMAIGQVISAAISERSIRVIVTDGFFTLSCILIFLASGWIGSPDKTRSLIANPLGAMHHFLSPDAASTQVFPWSSWLTSYGIAFAALVGLAYRKLWEWSPPPDWGPKPRTARPFRQGERKSAPNASTGTPPVDGGDPR